MAEQVPYELENGEIIIAQLCSCNEERDEGTYLVHFKDDDTYVIAHESCLEVVDD